MELRELGEFEIVSGEVVVGDPRYNKDNWNLWASKKTKCGKWKAFTEVSSNAEYGMSNDFMYVVHENFALEFNPLAPLPWTNLEFQVLVDSGQVGVFDSHYYEDDSVVIDMDVSGYIVNHRSKWYRACWNKSAGPQLGGVIPFGAVCSPGYGDMSYPIYAVFSESGEVIMIKIDFLDGHDTYDDDNWMYDWNDDDEEDNEEDECWDE